MNHLRTVKPSHARALTCAVALLFLLSMLLTSLYIDTHLCHQHNQNAPGGGCSICAALASANILWKILATTAFFLGLQAFLRTGAAHTLAHAVAHALTPVAQKTRLNF
jgi:hypothetical protein